MAKEIFQSFQGGIKGGTSLFGLTVEADEIKFHDARRLVRDFSKLSGISRSEIKSKFKKEFKGKHVGCRAELLVTVDKPFVVSYDKKMEVNPFKSFYTDMCIRPIPHSPYTIFISVILFGSINTLSDEGPMLETLPTILYFDLYL